MKKKLNKLFSIVINRFPYLFRDDKTYLSRKYRLRFSRDIDWENPMSFNEKLNWLKLNDRNPLYTILADKYEVKHYVSKIIGENYVVPCYGIWGGYKDINFDELPDKFVLKATHDSGGLVICKDKSLLDHKKNKALMDKVLQRNFFYQSREWPYKNIKPRILAEMFLDDGRKGELQDYKFWCFNGVPTYMYMTNKGKLIFENFYDMDFNIVEINHGYPRFKPEYQKPTQFEEMKSLATKLSKGIPFVRVDFFVVDGNVYFSEYTFYDWGGLRPFADYDTDLELGAMIHLWQNRKDNFNETIHKQIQ